MLNLLMLPLEKCCLITQTLPCQGYVQCLGEIGSLSIRKPVNFYLVILSWMERDICPEDASVYTVIAFVLNVDMMCTTGQSHRKLQTIQP